MLYYSVTSSTLFPMSSKTWELNSTTDLSQIICQKTSMHHECPPRTFHHFMGFMDLHAASLKAPRSGDVISKSLIIFLYLFSSIPLLSVKIFVPKPSELLRRLHCKVSPKAASHISFTEKTILYWIATASVKKIQYVDETIGCWF